MYLHRSSIKVSNYCLIKPNQLRPRLLYRHSSSLVQNFSQCILYSVSHFQPHHKPYNRMQKSLCKNATDNIVHWVRFVALKFIVMWSIRHVFWRLLDNDVDEAHVIPNHHHTATRVWVWSIGRTKHRRRVGAIWCKISFHIHGFSLYQKALIRV